MRLFDKAPIHRDAVGILDFSYHDDAVKATDAVDVAQGVEHEVLVVLHVVGIHLDLEIVIASGVVAFRNLVYLLHGVHKLLYQVVGVRFCRSKVGEGDKCTLAASSFTVILEFCCKSRSILMSISSSVSCVAIVMRS